MLKRFWFAWLAGMVLSFSANMSNAQIQFQSGFSSDAGFTVLTSSETDNRATFGYDYSLDAIPQAPNGSDRIGLKLEANLEGLGGTLRRLAVFPTTFTPTGNYRFSVDIWGNYSVFGSGTTEHMGAFVGHDGVTDPLHGGGLIYSNEGGALQDLRLYRNLQHLFIGSAGGAQTPSLQYSPEITSYEPPGGVPCDPEAPVPGTSSYQDCRDTNFTRFWQDRVPGFNIEDALDPAFGQGFFQSGAQNDGVFGFQWITMQFDVFPNSPGPAGITSDLGYADVSLFFHGSIENPNVPPTELHVGTLDNSAGVGPLVDFAEKPAVVYWDIFASVADEPQYQFAVFDNFIVESLETPGVTGDFNNDGVWDCQDLNALTNAIATGSTDLSFDMNGDGVIDFDDVSDANLGWLAVGGANNPGVTGGNPFLPGDANLDGNVDGQDFIVWNTNKFTSTNDWCSGNFNGDTAADGQDFIIWNLNKFTASDSVAVPEPANLMLLLLAIAGFTSRYLR